MQHILVIVLVRQLMHKIIDLNLFGELLSELAKLGDANADETFRRYARRQFGLDSGT